MPLSEDLKNRVEAFFVVFISLLLIAPFSFHMDWHDYYLVNKIGFVEALQKCTQKGELYLLASIFSATSIIDYRTYLLSKGNNGSSIFRVSKYICWLPIIMAFFDLMPIRYRAATPHNSFFIAQIFALVIAILTSLRMKYKIYWPSQVVDEGK